VEQEKYFSNNNFILIRSQSVLVSIISCATVANYVTIDNQSLYCMGVCYLCFISW